MLRLAWVAGLSIGLASCQWPARNGRPDPRSRAFPLDSIVLERTLCYGGCPAYRLRVSAGGGVAFESHNPGVQGRVATDSLGPGVMDSLIALAERIDLFALPDTIDGTPPHCWEKRTDHPTVRLNVFGVRAKRLDYYTGCYTREGVLRVSTPVQQLMAFAAAMDTLTQAHRWIRPARGR